HEAAMFTFLGKAVARAWPAFLAGWALLVVAAWWMAPPWSSVAEEREFALLPEDLPSRRGEALFQKAFPDGAQRSSVVVVVHRDGQGLKEGDFTAVEKTLKPALLRIAEKNKSIVAKVQDFKEPGAGVLLTSVDGKATLVVLDLATEYTEQRNWPVL